MHVPGDDVKVVLEARGLSKRFGDFTAVDDLSLRIHAGEVFGFLGPNGAGKTTSISMICGLLRPSAGSVLIKGQPIEGGSVEVRTRVGVCPQQLVIWREMSCIEQLVFLGEMYDVPRARARARGEQLLESMGLSEKRDALARTLSGGMQRRLNVLLALVHDPEIVVLDEPEAGLDPQSRVLVREYIQSLARKKTVILTTHNMDEADRVADRVAIIDRGKLLTLDSPEALKRSVGEGDVLELSCGQGQEAVVPRALAAARGLCEHAAVVQGAIVIRAQGLVERLPDLLAAVRATGFAPGDVRLRENSLEDVFITLTGRRLRE